MGLSKSRVIAHLQCPKRLWLQTYHPELAEVDSGSQTRMNVGTTVGEIARTLFPDGHLVETNDLRAALAETASLLQSPGGPIFEATLQAAGTLVRVDILQPQAHGYHLIEVKSATHIKPYYAQDTAIQTWISREAGVPVLQSSIATINNQFVYPGNSNYHGLFSIESVDTLIAPLLPAVPQWISAAQATLAGGEPDIVPGDQCETPFSCPFIGYCEKDLPNPPEYPVELLPRGRATAAVLRAEGYEDLREVPKNRLSHPLHQRIHQASLDKKAFLGPEAAEILQALPFPRFYMDFETINPAIPLWANSRPYQQIPFQWSCHREDADGSITHDAYLADGQDDPRPLFLNTLLLALGDTGPILVYNAGFENTRLRELAEQLPHQSQAVQSVLARVVDLLPIARDYYYHPAMKGSWSIKAVLPTIAPELAYDDLEVANGGMAQEAFMEMLSPDTDPLRREAIRAALLTYCERDTLAMIHIARYFMGEPHG